jgi:catechol 2,3-dioxygenase-like lactoylglutathione lyase family enzyme
MAKITRPDIECERQHPTLAVADVTATIDFYTNKLGFTRAFVWGGEPPTFAGLNLGDVQIFIQKGKPDGQAASVAFVVGNADELFDYHRGNGVTVTEPIADREYGIRDYGVLDNNGHHLSFGQYIFGQGEPIVIERVDVPVRLEKRLAALLLDLAVYKRMSLSSCLEEILLHTTEPLGDGVASPHTRGQLAHIQRLKAKHGIEYDSHGSYRFVEKLR